jgi:glycosyltransferase involved in cell wall biosynthesis
MKICFWGDISGAIKGTTIGGGELQMALLAKSLAKEGHEVVIIDPYSKESFVTEEGIQVFNIPGWNKGLPVIRMFWNRIPALYKLLVKQKADYYYVRMRSYLNLISYMASRKAKGKFLQAVASDIDLLSLRDKYKYEYKANFRAYKYFSHHLPNDIIFKYLLKRADFIVLQHTGQVIKMRIRGKKVMFPNILDHQNLPVADGEPGQYLIYVGSLTMLKGADKLYDIVNALKIAEPVMIVGQPNDSHAKPIFEKLKELRNTDAKGRIQHSDTLKLIANAKALINTSDFEGFPNVFLEAWSMGIPVLSLKVNPGKIFDKYQLGMCFGGDVAKMKEYINTNRAIPSQKEQMLSYVREFHDSTTAGLRFVNLLKNETQQ